MPEDDVLILNKRYVRRVRYRDNEVEIAGEIIGHHVMSVDLFAMLIDLTGDVAFGSLSVSAFVFTDPRDFSGVVKYKPIAFQPERGRVRIRKSRISHRPVELLNVFVVDAWGEAEFFSRVVHPRGRLKRDIPGKRGRPVVYLRDLARKRREGDTGIEDEVIVVAGGKPAERLDLNTRLFTVRLFVSSLHAEGTVVTRLVFHVHDRDVSAAVRIDFYGRREFVGRLRFRVRLF